MSYIVGNKYIFRENPTGITNAVIGYDVLSTSLHGRSFTYTGVDGNNFHIFSGNATELIKYKPEIASSRTTGVIYYIGDASYKITGLFQPNPVTITPTTDSNPTTNPCFNFNDYGYNLAEYSFVWKEEAKTFLAKPEVSQVSTLNSKAMNVYQEVLLSRTFWNGRIDIDGMKVICTDHKIADLACFIEFAKYDAVPEYDMFIAKFKIPKEIIIQRGTFGNVDITNFISPDGYYYVSENGQLCFFEKSTDEDPINDGNNPINPGPVDDPITPDTPLIGAGQTHSLVDDTFSDYEIETSTLWPNQVINLEDKYTEATDASEDIDYCVSVYDKPDDEDCRTELFKILYGDYEGKGAIDLGGNDNETLTKAMYTQYANLLLPQGQDKFIINGAEQDAVYILNFNRKLYKDGLDAGNVELSFNRLEDTNSYPNTNPLIVNFGFDGFGRTLVDEHVKSTKSIDNTKPVAMREGTLESGLTDTEEFAIMYPSKGIIVFRPEVISMAVGDPVVREVQSSSKNPYKFYRAILTNSFAVEEGNQDASGDYFGFKARNIEYKHVRYAFVRLKNSQFNFSNNPTYVTDAEGSVIDTMVGDSKVYITSIGIYNANKELLAVGKFSKPLLKSAVEEAAITIKIEQ